MKTLAHPVPPGGTVGIIGGGQLGRMLVLAAARLGLKAAVYNDTPDAPAFQVTPLSAVGAYDDLAALEKFTAGCDVVTFEFENLPAHAIAHLGSIVPVQPGAEALALTQDRLTEKTFVSKLGLKTAPFFEVSSPEQARDAFAKVGERGILKTRRFGYDGKGQQLVTNADEAAAVFAKFGVPSILEGFVPFVCEVSVIGVRGADGSFESYDPPENVHEHHILRRSTMPSRLSAIDADRARAMARAIGEALDYVGVFAVEMFVGADGHLVVNEIAPRVHNSGHWTIEACQCSQFENHVRAVAGWPLGSTERHADVAMENIIGAEANAWESLAKSGALHLYGKAEARPGRKMGHVTRLKPRS